MVGIFVILFLLHINFISMESSKKSWMVWVIAIIAVAIIIIVAIVSGKNKDTSPAEEGPIIIGYIGPLSGDSTIYGETIKAGIDLRVKEVNDAGGIAGRQIVVISEDGKCEGKAASLAAQKLITADKVQVILGGQCSNETMAAAPIAEENKVLLFTPFSSAPAVTDAGEYVFQLWPSDVIAADRIAQLMKDKGVTKVSILSEQGEYAQGLREAIKPFFEKQGLTLVYDESYATDVVDFKSYAAKLNAAGADGIFLNPQSGASGARLAKALRDQGNKAQFFAYYISDDAFVKSGTPVEGTYLLDFDTVSDKSKGQILLDSYKTQYGKDPAYAAGVVLGYDSAGIVFEALKAVGNDASRVKNYLYNMSAFPGVTGNITFDRNGGPIGNHNFAVTRIEKGKMVKE